MSFSIPTLKLYRKVSAGCSYSTTSNTDTVFLLHGENFTDYGYQQYIYNTDYTQAGVSINSSPSKFCNNYYFNGSAYIEIPSDFTNHIDDYTLEMWLYVSSIPTSMAIISPSVQGLAWFISSSDGKMYISNNITGSASSTQAVPLNSWFHTAITYDSAVGSSYLYITGVLQTGQGGAVSTPISQYSYIGSGLGGSTSNLTNAYIDEIRLSSGQLYTGSTYTVPTSPFS